MSMQCPGLPQNMAARHKEYVKLKEFEKQHVMEKLSDLPLKQVIKPSHETCPLYTQRKEHPYLPKMKGHRDEPA